MINLKHPLDLGAALPGLLPKAVAWAERAEKQIRAAGRPLSAAEVRTARGVEVEHPERVRIALVPEIPMPDDTELRAAALESGLFGPHAAGLTLRYGIYLVQGRMTPQLLAHECRHVHQYEDAGSIDAFLHEYLRQLVTVGYWDAPYEVDARKWSE